MPASVLLYVYIMLIIYSVVIYTSMYIYSKCVSTHITHILNTNM